MLLILLVFFLVFFFFLLLFFSLSRLFCSTHTLDSRMRAVCKCEKKILFFCYRRSSSLCFKTINRLRSVGAVTKCLSFTIFFSQARSRLFSTMCATLDGFAPTLRAFHSYMQCTHTHTLTSAVFFSLLGCSFSCPQRCFAARPVTEVLWLWLCGYKCARPLVCRFCCWLLLSVFARSIGGGGR